MELGFTEKTANVLNSPIEISSVLKMQINIPYVQYDGDTHHFGKKGDFLKYVIPSGTVIGERY